MVAYGIKIHTQNKNTLRSATNSSFLCLTDKKLSEFLFARMNGQSLDWNIAALDWFNVCDYGAIIGASTDQSAAIQAALTAAATAGGGVVYFPTGCYKITTGLTLVNPSNIILLGSGATEIYFDYTEQSSIQHALILGRDSATSYQTIIQNITFKGNENSNSNGVLAKSIGKSAFPVKHVVEESPVTEPGLMGEHGIGEARLLFLLLGEPVVQILPVVGVFENTDHVPPPL
jgi:hypothetical protein